MASKKSKKSDGTVGTATVKSKPENVVESGTSDIQTLADTPQYLAAYSPKTWINGETIYNTDLNHAEQGIADAQNTADAANDVASAAQNTADAVEASALTGVSVNGTAASVSNHVAEIDISNSGVYYGTSSTAYGTATKVVACTDLKDLVAGVAILVSFDNYSRSQVTKLNVNSTGAKSLYVNGAEASSSNCFRWVANTDILFIYDGAYWLPVGFLETYYGESSTGASTATKTATISDYVLQTGTQVSILFSDSNTSSSPLLNIGSTGAFYISGNTAWSAGDIVSFVFDGDRYVVQENGNVNGGAIEHIQVNGEEQPIEDKTVNLDIDKSSVDGETLIVGDTTGGDAKFVGGSFGEYEGITLTGAGMIILCGDGSKQTIYSFFGRSATVVSGSSGDYGFDSVSGGVEIYDNNGFTETKYTIIYVWT